MHGDVDAISFKGKWRGKDRDRDTRRKEGTERSSDKEFRDKEFTCKRCGGQHKARQCPAFGKTCSRCHGQNHYARMCPSRETERKVHVVNETDDSDSQSDPEFVYMVTEGGSEIEETGQPVNADETVRPVNAVQTDKWEAPLLVSQTRHRVKSQPDQFKGH